MHLAKQGFWNIFDERRTSMTFSLSPPLFCAWLLHSFTFLFSISSPEPSRWQNRLQPLETSLLCCPRTGPKYSAGFRKRQRDTGFDCYPGSGIRQNLGTDAKSCGKKMIFGIVAMTEVENAGRSWTNGAGMQDQDSLSRPHANDSLKPTFFCHQSKSWIWSSRL